MSLLQGLGLLGLLGIPIIILIYLLKSKYTQKPVSSTYIWQRSLKYVKTRLPLNFTVSLLLVLQILMVVLASFALARPTIPSFLAKDTIIVLDSSASMKTMTDEGKTRYELAVDAILKEAESAGETNKITLIIAGATSEMVVPRTTTKTEIVNALEKTECGDSVPDIDGALKSVNSIQEINPEAKVLFYTDKQYMDHEGIEVVDLSKDTDVNVAITTLTDSLTGGKYIFNATLNNYGSKEQAVTVKFLIDLEFDGVHNPTETRRNTYTLAPDEKKVVTFSNSAVNVLQGNEFFQIDKLNDYESVRIEIESPDDGLATDNARTLYATAEKRVKILVVSKHVVMMKTPEGDEIADQNASTFLVMAMRTIGYSLSNKTDIKNDLSKVNNGGAIEGYDLYIFDGVMPDVLPDDGAVWFIDPPADPPAETGLRLEGLEPLEAQVGKPFYFIPDVESKTDAYKTLVKNIGGQNGQRKLAVGKFQPIGIEPDLDGDANYQYESIFVCEGNGINETVMLAGKVGTVRVVCLSMDLHKSNLVVNIDFPLLLQNMMAYSLPSVVGQRSYEVGQTVKFNAPVGSETINFMYEGAVLNSLSANDTEFTLDKIGNYAIEVVYANEDIENAYYMLPTSVPADESDIVVSAESIVPLEVITTTTPEPDPIEIWPYIAMALLALAIIEWGVYYRDEF